MPLADPPGAGRAGAAARRGPATAVDSATLALALLAGPSRAGGWCAAVGVADFGAEAAVALGVDLDRTVLVPDPGEQWLEVTAALVDVATVVLVRPAGRVTPSGRREARRPAAQARRRARSSWGEWPRCEVRLTASEPAWAGVGQGHGHLRARRLVVEAQTGYGAAAPRGAVVPGRGPVLPPRRPGRASPSSRTGVA